MLETIVNKASELSRDDVEEIRGLLLQLNAAVKNTQLYSPEHPLAREFNERLLRSISKQIEKREHIILMFVEGQVLLNRIPLHELGEQAPGFVRICLDKHIQSITFSSGIGLGELNAFIEIMAIPSKQLVGKGDIQQEIISRGISHIAVESLAKQEQTSDATSSDLERREAVETYERAISEIKKAMEDVRLHQTITNVQGIKDTVGNVIDSLLGKVSIMLGLTSIMNYDEYTFYHSVNVSILTLSLGVHLSLPRGQLEKLGVAAILHDVGKILIPEHILNKSRELNEAEWDIMQKHPVDGARILRKTPGIPKCAPVVAYEHHIKYNLSGYPPLAKQRPLSLYSLSVEIADSYDAMTSLRPYRKPKTPVDALKTMLEPSSTDFEPRLLNKFAETLGTYPPGSFVRLDTNEFAVVHDIDPEHHRRPTVNLAIDPEGHKLASGELVDLREKSPRTGNYRRSIVQVLNPVSMGVNISDFL